MKEQQNNLFGEVVEPTLNDLIIVKSAKDGSKPLSKEQKEFNRLVKKIEKLTNDIEEKEQVLEDILAKYHTAVKPVKIEIAQSLVEFAKKIHHSLQKFKFTNSQCRELSGMIVSFLNVAFESIEPGDELKELYNQYSFEGTYDEIVDEDMASNLDDLIEELEFNLGIEIDRDSIPDMKTASKEEMAAFIGSLYEKVEAEQSELTTEESDEHKDTRKKTKTQQQKEIKEKAAVELKTKNLRSLYLSLAKALHPDTGGSEEEVARKEELMKQVTNAYDNKDLSTLLKLEITWLRDEVGQSKNRADKQLKVYNQVLREQVVELEQRQFSITRNPRFFEIEAYCFAETKEIPVMLNEELEDLNVRLADIQEDFLSVKNKKTLLEFIKVVKGSAVQHAPIDLLDSLFDLEEMEDFFF